VERETTTGGNTLPLPFQFLAVWVGVWFDRHQADQIEYLKTVSSALLELLGKKRMRFTDAERKKLAVLGKKLGRKALAEAAMIATPDTIVRWYGELVAKKYDGSARRGPGRPHTAAEVVRLLVEMATRNTSWGYTRLRGALKNVGYALGRNTIKRILKEHGIDPAPVRPSAVLVGDLHQGTPERDCGGRLLHGGGAELGWPGPVPRLLSH
jgi:putative transposase